MASKRANATHAGAVLLLSLLWAAEPLQRDLLPQLNSSEAAVPFAQILTLAVTALAALVLALARRQWLPSRPIWRAAGIGIGLLAAPSILLQLGQLTGVLVSAFTRTALFTLVPVFTVVFEPYLGRPEEEPARASFPAAIAVLAGATLVFPLGAPASILGVLEFASILLAAACVAAVSCSAWRILNEADSSRDPVDLPASLLASSKEPQQRHTAATAAIATTASALTLAAWHMTLSIFGLSAPFAEVSWSFPQVIWICAIQVPALLLLFWLLASVRPAQAATRYGFAPLFAILAGMAALRTTQLPARSWVGMALMAAGCSWLLIAPGQQPVTTHLSPVSEPDTGTQTASSQQP